MFKKKKMAIEIYPENPYAVLAYETQWGWRLRDGDDVLAEGVFLGKLYEAKKEALRVAQLLSGRLKISVQREYLSEVDLDLDSVPHLQ